MAISVNSTVKEILDNPTACEILESIQPGSTKDPRLKMAAGMTLRAVLGMAGVKADDVAELDKTLQEKCN